MEGDSLQQNPLTVYSLRFSTGVRRGSSLSDPLSPIWVCLVGENGKSFLHRISSLFDAEEEEKNLHAICEVRIECCTWPFYLSFFPTSTLLLLPSSYIVDCSFTLTSTAMPLNFSFEHIARVYPVYFPFQIVDVAAGANCALALKSSGHKPTGSSSVSQRFLQGDVDEVSFMGPELGQITALIVGPESGSWNLDEVTVTSSRTEQTTLFICREVLGGRNRDGAAFLTPVPLNTVQYGSGASGVSLTKVNNTVCLHLKQTVLLSFNVHLLLCLFLYYLGSIVVIAMCPPSKQTSVLEATGYMFSNELNVALLVLLLHYIHYPAVCRVRQQQYEKKIWKNIKGLRCSSY